MRWGPTALLALAVGPTDSASSAPLRAWDLHDASPGRPVATLSCSSHPGSGPSDTTKPFTGWIAKVEGGADLWLRNTSKDTLTIDTLHLSRCRNLSAPCGAHPVAFTVAPGRDTVIFRARRAAARGDAEFRWSLSWSRIVAAPESTVVRWRNNGT